MSDIKLTSERDIDITNGKLSLITSKDEFITQQLKIRLGTYQGEWYLDTSLGLPYFQTILKKGVDKELVDSIFKKAISDQKGVDRIVTFRSKVTSYEYSLSFTFQSVDGTLISLFDNIAI